MRISCGHYWQMPHVISRSMPPCSVIFNFCIFKLQTAKRYANDRISIKTSVYDEFVEYIALSDDIMAVFNVSFYILADWSCLHVYARSSLKYLKKWCSQMIKRILWPDILHKNKSKRSFCVFVVVFVHHRTFVGSETTLIHATLNLSHITNSKII